MRTKDSISKKRQKLWQEVAFWKAREQAVFTGDLFSAENENAAKFCRQEVAKRHAELEKLQTRTWRQVRAGWR